jgi:hypothetical protein
VHLAGDLLAELGEVVLGVGVLDVGQEIGSLADEMGAAPEVGLGPTRVI